MLQRKLGEGGIYINIVFMTALQFSSQWTINRFYSKIMCKMFVFSPQWFSSVMNIYINFELIDLLILNLVEALCNSKTIYFCWYWMSRSVLSCTSHDNPVKRSRLTSISFISHYMSGNLQILKTKSCKKTLQYRTFL